MMIRAFFILTAFPFLVSAAPIPGEIIFPPGAVLNVRDHGLPGDGSDQTDSLEALLKRTVGSYKHLYFPNGTYRISRTLVWRDAVGDPQSGLTLIGQSREKSILQLADSAQGFGDSAVGKAMFLTFSQKAAGNGDGEENAAFRNSIRNLTFDVGLGNPGAIAVDYICSNIGGIQDVSVRSRDPRGGRIGLKIDRGSPGPLLIRNVSVQGFRWGITTDCRIAGLTLEHISLSDQRAAGIRNCQNTLSIRDLRSVNAVPALQNVVCPESRFDTKLPGMVVLIDASLEGGAPGTTAIENGGSLLLRNVSVKGYARALRSQSVDLPGRYISEYTSTWGLGRGHRSRFALFDAPPRTLGLPVKEAPAYYDTDFSHWAVVTDSAYGAKPDDGEDDCGAIAKALRSGKSTIFLKRGYYICEEALRIGPNVRHILGDNAWIAVRDLGPRGIKDLLVMDAAANFDVRVENIDLRDNGERNDTLTFIRHASRRSLILAGVYLLSHSNSIRAYAAGPGAGPLFLEDVASSGASPWRFAKGQKIWARQFNPEGSGPKIVNPGADFWVLGLKTENPGTVLLATGGSNEVLGGMVVPADSVDPAHPAFDLQDARASLSYAFNNAVSQTGEWYETQVRERRGKSTRALRWDSVTTSEGNWVRNLHVPLYCAGVVAAKPATPAVAKAAGPAPASKAAVAAPAVKAVVPPKPAVSNGKGP